MRNTNIELIKRYFIFFLGLFIMGLGIALTTKSKLGTSPISSLPYVVSIITPLTFGQVTFFLALLFITIQYMILGKSFFKEQYMQLVVGPFFGVFIDIGMLVFTYVDPQVYIGKLVAVILGCFVLAVGIYFQVIANVTMNPGEAVVKVITNRVKKEFGIVKIIFDWTLVSLAAIISIVSIHTVVGIREGTLLSAFLVGYFIKTTSPILNKHLQLEKWFTYNKKATILVEQSTKENKTNGA